MRVTRPIAIAVSLSALLVLDPAGVRAEAPSATTSSTTRAGSTDLSSEDALVHFALTHNPDLRAARWDQDIAAASVTSASALNNPVARGEWLHVQSPVDFGYGVGLAWAPPQPGVYGSGKDVARAQMRAVTADYSERRAELEASIRRSYAQIAALTEQISLAEKSVETRRSVHLAIKERVSHGASSRIDLSLVAVSLARGEQERDLLLLARATEITQLEALLGLPPGQSLSLTPQLTTEDAGREVRASTDRPQLQADAARAEAADSTLSVERAKRWPWLELQARYRKHDQAAHPDDVTLGVEITLPIFNQNPGPIAAAEASRQALRDVATAHRLGIERDVRVLRVESARRREIAEHYAQSIAPVLTEHAALVKQALSGMELDLTALLTAEDMVTRSGIEYLDARLAQRKAEIALARALGEYGRDLGAK